MKLFTFKKTGINNLDKLKNKFKKINNDDEVYKTLSVYGEIGVKKLSSASEFKNSKWKYNIKKNSNNVWKLSWSNISNNTDTPIILNLLFGGINEKGEYDPPKNFVTPILNDVVKQLEKLGYRRVK